MEHPPGLVPAIASATSVLDAAGKVRRRIQLLRYGNPFFGRDNTGPFILRDRDHAMNVIAATRAFHGETDMLIDYDHQSVYAAGEGKGGRAEAAGWGTELIAGDDGIYAEVDWTDDAEAQLAARKYRYISPFFYVDRETREVTRIVNAALTNSPRLELAAVAALNPGETSPMKKIAALLNLGEDAGEDEIVAAIKAMMEKATAMSTSYQAIAASVDLGADADAEAIVAAVKAKADAGDPDPTKFVDRAAFDALKTRFDQREEEGIAARVDTAIADGKLIPAMKDWALRLGKKSPDELQAYLASAPAFSGGAQLGKKPENAGKGELTADEAAICSQLGLSKDDYIKLRDEEEAL